MTSRREFLVQAGGCSLILGFPLLGCRTQEVPPKASLWLDRALQRMRAERKPGIAIRVPDGPAERETLAVSLVQLIDSRDEDVREIFCESVFVCLGSNEFDRLSNGQVALIDESGHRVEGVSFDAFGDNSAFLDAFRRLLHGERIAKNAERIRKTTFKGLVEALERLDADGSMELVSRHADTIVPLLVYTRLASTNPEDQARLRSILNAYFDRIDIRTPGPRLPYGAAARAQVVHGGGCGGHLAWEDEPCASCDKSEIYTVTILCGMMVASPSSRRFLKFLIE